MSEAHALTEFLANCGTDRPICTKDLVLWNCTFTQIHLWKHFLRHVQYLYLQTQKFSKAQLTFKGPLAGSQPLLPLFFHQHFSPPFSPLTLTFSSCSFTPAVTRCNDTEPMTSREQEGAWTNKGTGCLSDSLLSPLFLGYLALQQLASPPGSPGQKGKVGVRTKVGRRYGSPEGM